MSEQKRAYCVVVQFSGGRYMVPALIIATHRAADKRVVCEGEEL